MIMDLQAKITKLMDQYAETMEQLKQERDEKE